jgi:hypothetical protein
MNLAWLAGIGILVLGLRHIAGLIQNSVHPAVRPLDFKLI